MKTSFGITDDGVRVERRRLSGGYPWSIILPKPPTVNHMYIASAKRGVRFPSPELREWWAKVDALIEKIETPMYAGQVWISITVEDTGTGDIDNRIKAVLDLLVKKKVIVDDSRKYLRGVYADWGNVTGCRVEVSPFPLSRGGSVHASNPEPKPDPVTTEIKRVFAKKPEMA